MRKKLSKIIVHESTTNHYNSTAISTINIVRVEGCPKTGYYGQNCSTPCPDRHCRYCHIETGTCQGCLPGYHGHRCELGNLDNLNFDFTVPLNGDVVIITTQNNVCMNNN